MKDTINFAVDEPLMNGESALQAEVHTSGRGKRQGEKQRNGPLYKAVIRPADSRGVTPKVHT